MKSPLTEEPKSLEGSDITAEREPAKPSNESKHTNNGASFLDLEQLRL